MKDDMLECRDVRIPGMLNRKAGRKDARMSRWKVSDILMPQCHMCDRMPEC
jgi:hypothetical protein